MATLSSPQSKSPSISVSSSSTWSSSPSSSFSDYPYSTPDVIQPSSFQFSKNLSVEGNRYLGSPSIYSTHAQDVSRASRAYSGPGNGSSSWSSKETERGCDSLGVRSSGIEQSHESMGMNSFAPQLGNVLGALGNQLGPMGSHPPYYTNPYAGTRVAVGTVVEGRENPSVGSMDEDYGARLPYQTVGSRRSTSQSEQDMGGELIICQLGCRSKRGFKDQQSFEAHLRNVHCKKQLACPEQNCVLAFHNKTDLTRHQKTVHEKAKTWRCLRPDCPARAKEFSRKDKLIHHNRKHHSKIKCWFCSQDPQFEVWFEHDQELWDHTYEKHFDQHLESEQYTSRSTLLPGHQEH